MNEIKHTISQYLSFMLNGRIYAFDVLKTREVLSYARVTPIPCTPEYVNGVLNLRGSVVTVIDLRLKFGMPASPITIDSAILIVESVLNNESVVVGALVDAVKGVLRFDETQIEPPPKVGMMLNPELITAIGKRNDDFVVILNVDKVFSEEDLHFIKETNEESIHGESNAT